MQMKRFCIIIPDGTLAPFYKYVQVGYGCLTCPTLLLHQHNTCANAASLPPSMIVLTLFQGQIVLQQCPPEQNGFAKLNELT